MADHDPEGGDGKVQAVGRATGMMVTFTDPSLVFGGGLNVFVTRHLAIRRDVETMIVAPDSSSRAATALTVHLGLSLRESRTGPK